MDGISKSAQKTTCKTFKQFSYSSNSFQVIIVLDVKIEPKLPNIGGVIA